MRISGPWYVPRLGFSRLRANNRELRTLRVTVRGRRDYSVLSFYETPKPCYGRCRQGYGWDGDGVALLGCGYIIIIIVVVADGERRPVLLRAFVNVDGGCCRRGGCAKSSCACSRAFLYYIHIYILVYFKIALSVRRKTTSSSYGLARQTSSPNSVRNTCERG